MKPIKTLFLLATAGAVVGLTGCAVYPQDGYAYGGNPGYGYSNGGYVDQSGVVYGNGVISSGTVVYPNSYQGGVYPGAYAVPYPVPVPYGYGYNGYRGNDHGYRGGRNAYPPRDNRPPSGGPGYDQGRPQQPTMNQPQQPRPGGRPQAERQQPQANAPAPSAGPRPSVMEQIMRHNEQR